MTDPSPSQRSPLWRRLLLLFLVEADVALGLVLLMRIRPEFPYLGLILFDSGMLGLTCGLGTRFLMKERHWVLRSLAATAVLSIGLFILGMASGWRYGIGPLGFRSFDMAGAIQLATGLLVGFLASSAWSKPAVHNQVSTNVPPSTPVQTEQPARLKSRRPMTRRRPKQVSGARSRARSRKSLRAAIQKIAQERKSPKVLSTKSRPRRRARRPEVQFASTEEHRCPYCLEIVHENDPRGIVECKICHALHHADCWAITGTCQVPHLNA